MLKRCRLKICLLALALTQVAFPFGSFAQPARPEAKRKVIVETRPVYPPLAGETNLSGVVRLPVTVSPASYPVSTEQLGGSHLMVKAATEAVSRAKWELTSVDQRNRPIQI
jgi:TonB-like protein